MAKQKNTKDKGESMDSGSKIEAIKQLIFGENIHSDTQRDSWGAFWKISGDSWEFHWEQDEPWRKNLMKP